MNEALCSILSDEDTWCFEEDCRTIKFNKDGTGELWCRVGLNHWIVVDTQWKGVKSFKHAKPQDKSVEIANKGPRLLGYVDIEITLVKRLPEWVRTSILAQGKINEHCLTDDAFRPKLYSIRIEKGDFIEPRWVGSDSSLSSRYALRIIFDKSPYPPRSEWKNPDHGPDDFQFWNHKEFVGRKLPEPKNQGQAMNEIPSAG